MRQGMPEAPMKQQTLTMQDAQTTAKMLSEALPYLQRYADAVVVVKFGGNAMGDDAAMAEFARDIVLMKQVGVHPVVVHGGGPMINEMLTKLGIKSEFVRGKRVTDKATVEVVEMVLSGLVNKRIVQAIMDAGGRAVGISGKDDDLMVCEPDDPELGFVGRPVEMNVQVLRDLYNAGIIPVVAPVATGMKDNETFNVNGDTAAGAIAGALKADRLLLMTDVAGVKDASGQVMTQLSPEEIRRLTAEGTIAGGMIPKTETALKAIEEGARAVTILDGRIPNAALLELFTDHGAGSQIRSTEPRVKPRVKR
jgi:acetylglutamate kinase